MKLDRREWGTYSANRKVDSKAGFNLSSGDTKSRWD